MTKYLKKKNQQRYHRFLIYLKIYKSFKNISQEFRLKNIHHTRTYFLEEIGQSKLMSKKHKKVCTTLVYIEHFLILASAITGCI